MLVGQYDYAIDAKGRLNFPARFRDAMGETFIVTRWLDHCLAAFPAEIVAAADKYDPARITRYCIDVASAYHRFYNACRIMGTEGAVQQGRIALCLAVRGVIRNILTMFKVSVPETM